jgi:ADP-ribosylglycohydrolase
MGAAAAAAAAIAAAYAQQQNALIAQFRARGAVSRNTAVPLDAVGVTIDRRAFEYLLEEAVIREADPGRFYLDEETIRARERRKQRARPLLLIVAVVLAVVALALVVSMRRGAV